MDDSKEKANDIKKHRIYREYGKRIIDILLSLFSLILFSPLLVVLSVLVRIIHGSPIFFTPARPGKNEKIFRLYKFRTMSNARDKDGVLLPEKQRITKFGNFLRNSSMDELPELLNIIKGDMSFVGPRPLPMKYLPFYSESQRIRHSVRPGLTGLAQIGGRNNLKWEQRFEADLKYVKGMSPLIDASIVFDTVSKVFKGTDVVVPGDTDFYQFDTQVFIEREGDIHYKKDELSWREIGGSFWLEGELKESDDSNSTNIELIFPSSVDSSYTFSGRMSIEIAVKTIMDERHVRKAFVPSYCSFSILQTFINHNIPYQFYDVTWDGKAFKYTIDSVSSSDIVIIMAYFGLSRDNLNKTVELLKGKGCIVIEDITHSLLSDAQICPYSDYYVASLRKWFPTPAGGWIGRRGGFLKYKPTIEGTEAADKAMSAMKKKSAYIYGDSVEKESFLVDYSSFESNLVQLSCDLKIDQYSKRMLERLDVEKIIRKRRDNAKILLEELKGLDCLQELYVEENLEIIVPLYVPILVNNGQRDLLQKHLAKNGIYCQVTWPERMGVPTGIHGNELSLVCDQRYDKQDMLFMTDVIKSWVARGIQ